MSSTTLEVDRDAREVFNLAAIAIGTHDGAAALEVCRKLGEIEPHYRLALRTGDDPSRGQEACASAAIGARPESARRMAAKFAGRCATCHGPIQIGDSIFYNTKQRRVTHASCDESGRL